MKGQKMNARLPKMGQFQIAESEKQTKFSFLMKSQVKILLANIKPQFWKIPDLFAHVHFESLFPTDFNQSKF